MQNASAVSDEKTVNMKMDLSSVGSAHLHRSDEVMAASFVLCVRVCTHAKRGSEGEITCWACLYRLPGRIPCGLLELL